jgi:hypothetical protein
MATRYLNAFVAVALVGVGCNSPGRVIRPVIHYYEDDKYGAMKSAPVIVLAKILDAESASAERQVEKPNGMGGPDSPTIPMMLSRISARVLLPLRGNEGSTIEFYSWLWHGQKHGGTRIFSPNSPAYHILFLRREAGYLRTVGDYPTYDLLVDPDLLPRIVAGLKQGTGSDSDLLERIVTVSLKAELDSAGTLNDFISGWHDSWDFAGLTSPLYLATLLDSYCRQFPNRFGRFQACGDIALEFEGRCSAYNFAREADVMREKTADLAELQKRCERSQARDLADLSARKWPLTQFDFRWRETAERRRLDTRLFASAMDPKFRTAACGAAAALADGFDVPECRASEETRSRK